MYTFRCLCMSLAPPDIVSWNKLLVIKAKHSNTQDATLQNIICMALGWLRIMYIYICTLCGTFFFHFKEISKKKYIWKLVFARLLMHFWSTPQPSWIGSFELHGYCCIEIIKTVPWGSKYFIFGIQHFYFQFCFHSEFIVVLEICIFMDLWNWDKLNLSIEYVPKNTTIC